ncbi:MULTISPECIES: argonaute/piwi family protein [Pontibacter]|uniref:Piwi domain-containing protein n=1 Tax=Pontibacter virosus TaxID=1765052 RepID=A0A2U1B4T3_9BACT|nr:MULTISPECIES: hypothetical protein [Pontibacter]PVY43680.1 hypothetical protein C8E01_10136 [Pontibacter virosus]
MSISVRLHELPEPLLEFGGAGEFTDPKVGLREAGPYDLRFGNAARNTNIRLGLVGPQAMLLKARNWFSTCMGHIESTMKNIDQYPHYPGFESVFRCSLSLSSRWENTISETSLKEAISEKVDALAFEKVLQLYSDAIKRLASQEFSKPHVIICCLPEEVINRCWSIKNQVVKHTSKAKKISQQLNLFEVLPEVEETAEDLLNRDFRRALKAKAMECQIPIQIGRDRLFVGVERGGQDAATRAWHSSIAIYYKAGGIPWRLRSNGPETCYVGISFHHLYTTTNRHLVRSCIAQAFSSDGEGFAIRGANIPWDAKQDRNVHLTEKQAYEMGEKILENYSDRTGMTPQRVVIHKTSAFNEDETEGFRTALANIPIVELINLAPTDLRLVRHGEYPPKRGTLCIVNEANSYLFTTGFMPSLGTYPGPHIPAPLQIKSDQPIDVEKVAIDVLSLARMNWNTSSTTSGFPVTLFFARQVGGIMAEYGDREPHTSFRYYI